MINYKFAFISLILLVNFSYATNDSFEQEWCMKNVPVVEDVNKTFETAGKGDYYPYLVEGRYANINGSLKFSSSIPKEWDPVVIFQTVSCDSTNIYSEPEGRTVYLAEVNEDRTEFIYTEVFRVPSNSTFCRVVLRTAWKKFGNTTLCAPYRSPSMSGVIEMDKDVYTLETVLQKQALDANREKPVGLMETIWRLLIENIITIIGGIVVIVIGAIIVARLRLDKDRRFEEIQNKIEEAEDTYNNAVSKYNEAEINGEDEEFLNELSERIEIAEDKQINSWEQASYFYRKDEIPREKFRDLLSDRFKELVNAPTVKKKLKKSEGKILENLRWLRKELL